MNLKQLTNTKGEIWINCASGHYVMPEFVNFDNSYQLRLLFLYPILKLILKPNGSADTRFREYLAARIKNCVLLIHNCAKPFKLPDNSVDHILASHFVEHVYREEAKQLLKEFLRILKPSGTLHIIVPDLKCRAQAYLKDISNPEAANEFVRSLIFNESKRPHIILRFLEMIGGFGLFHRWMYDENSLKALVVESGFILEAQNNSPSAHWRREDDAGQVNLLASKAHHPEAARRTTS